MNQTNRSWKRISAVLLAVAVSGAVALRAESDRFIRKLKLTSGQTAVVAEGDCEARSIGSYTVRIYEGEDTTFYVTGLVRGRDGFIEKALLEDVSGDGQKDLIVVVRCVGTGSYLSADAFRVGDKQMVFLASADGLSKDADPVAALKQRVNWQKTYKTPWPGTAAWLDAIEGKLHATGKSEHTFVGSSEWFDEVNAKTGVSDARGHGPDPGSEEWLDAVHRKVFREEPPRADTEQTQQKK